MSCSKDHNAVMRGEAQTRGPSVLSQALCHCAPFLTLGRGLGAPGYPGGQKKKSNMVMWHIKLTGKMIQVKFYTMVKLVSLG